jgi:predicted nucleotidyltransferase
MKSFITGSHVYGKPHKNSDIDLVIYCDAETEQQLLELSNTGNYPIKFGKLNIIVAETEQQYQAWFEGRRKCLIAKAENNNKGLDKETCIKIHDEVRKFLGVSYGNQSERQEENDPL